MGQCIEIPLKVVMDGAIQLILMVSIAMAAAVVAISGMMFLLIKLKVQYRFASLFFAAAFVVGFSIALLISGFNPVWLAYATIVGTFLYLMMIACWPILGPHLRRHFKVRL